MKRFDVEVNHASGVYFVRSFPTEAEASAYANSMDDEMFPWVNIRQVFNHHAEER